jgi:nucleoside-diphosphate-sugar epimerase
MVGIGKRRVLVTGGSGFVGSRLAERLAIEEGSHVRVLVRDWRKAIWVSRSPIELIQGDITDSHALLNAMQGCDIVFHCAAAFGSLEECTRTNVEGTRHVLECAERAGVQRLVYISTVAVHGPIPRDGADERDPFRPTGDPYADTKIAAEELIRDFVQQRPLAVSIVRAAPVWGPRAGSFTLWPIHEMKAGRWFLVDGGRGTCNAVYIDNLVDAILLAAVNPAAAGEAFLITDDQPCSWSEFFGHYARMLGIRRLRSAAVSTANFSRASTVLLDRVLGSLQKTPSWTPAREAVRGTRFGLHIVRAASAQFSGFSVWELAKYEHRGTLDVSKARRLLGYSPRFTLEMGMRDTETWLRDQRLI